MIFHDDDVIVVLDVIVFFVFFRNVVANFDNNFFEISRRRCFRRDNKILVRNNFAQQNFHFDVIFHIFFFFLHRLSFVITFSFLYINSKLRYSRFINEFRWKFYNEMIKENLIVWDKFRWWFVDFVKFIALILDVNSLFLFFLRLLVWSLIVRNCIEWVVDKLSARHIEQQQ